MSMVRERRLAPVLGSLLAHHQAVREIDDDGAAWLAACAALVHGVAGVLAVGSGRPITSSDLSAALPDARSPTPPPNRACCKSCATSATTRTRFASNASFHAW